MSNRTRSHHGCVQASSRSHSRIEEDRNDAYLEGTRLHQGIVYLRRPSIVSHLFRSNPFLRLIIATRCSEISYIPFPSPDLPQTPPRIRGLTATEDHSPKQRCGEPLVRRETDASSISSWYSAESHDDSSVLLTPYTPVEHQVPSEKKATASPESKDATPSPTPQIIITRPSTDRLFDWFPHLFTNSPPFTPRLRLHDDDQDPITIEFEPLNRPVARVIQYEREPVEPMRRDSIALRAMMREDGLVGLGIGLENEFCGRLTNDGEGSELEGGSLVGRGRYVSVVREMNNIFSAQGTSGNLAMSLEPHRTTRLSKSSTHMETCFAAESAHGELQETTTGTSSNINSSVALSSASSFLPSRAVVPVEMIPLQTTDGSPSSSRTIKKRQSTTILKAKSSFDRLSRVFAQGFNKTISAFSSPGLKNKDDLEADIERYRSRGLGSPLTRWNGAIPSTMPFGPKKKGSQESGFSWSSPSLLRRPRAVTGEDQSINAPTPTSPSKTLRGRLPSFRLSFPRKLSDNGSLQAKKGLLPPGRYRCDSEESWGNVPLHVEQKRSDDRQVGVATIDSGRREACDHGIRSVPSLHLLRYGSAWGAMRNDAKQDTSATRRSSSLSRSSLSMSISDSSMTMYASHMPSPDAADEEERYKQIARLQTLALLEGKFDRRASSMVRDADGGNGGEGTVRRKGRGSGD